MTLRRGLKENRIAFLNLVEELYVPNYGTMWSERYILERDLEILLEWADEYGINYHYHKWGHKRSKCCYPHIHFNIDHSGRCIGHGKIHYKVKLEYSSNKRFIKN